MTGRSVRCGWQRSGSESAPHDRLSAQAGVCPHRPAGADRAPRCRGRGGGRGDDRDRPRRHGRGQGRERRPGDRGDPRGPAGAARRLVRHPGSDRGLLDARRERAQVPRRRQRARSRPRSSSTGRARSPAATSAWERSTASRRLGDAALGPHAANVRAGALRSRAAPRGRVAAERGGPAARRGRDGGDPLARALRRLRRSRRDRASPGGAQPRLPRRDRLPPAGAAAPRPRRGRRGARRTRPSSRTSTAATPGSFRSAPGTCAHGTSTAFAEDVAQARTSFQNTSFAADLTAPLADLQSASEASEVAGRRLLLVGGESAALLFAFAILAAVSMRRDTESARRRLTWFGARRWQLSLFTGTEAAAVAVVGTAVGWALGTLAGAVVASRAGAPGRRGTRALDPLAHGPASRQPSSLSRSPSSSWPRCGRSPSAFGRRSFSALDAAALGAVAVIAVTLLRGDLDQETLAQESGTAAALVLLPGLVTFVAAVVCARLLRPGLLLLERAPADGRSGCASRPSRWRGTRATRPSRRRSSSSASASPSSPRATARRSPGARRSRRRTPSRSTSPCGKT